MSMIRYMTAMADDEDDAGEIIFDMKMAFIITAKPLKSLRQVE